MAARIAVIVGFSVRAGSRSDSAVIQAIHGRWRWSRRESAPPPVVGRIRCSHADAVEEEGAESRGGIRRKGRSSLGAAASHVTV